MDTLRIDASNRSEFAGKRILVTGGTKGAGKAIADRFLQGGGTVMITARSAPEEQTESRFIQADVSTSEGTTKVIREILKDSRASTSLSTTLEDHPLRAAASSP